MRLFVLLSRVPYPLEKGDKLRAFHQIKSLSKHHKIVLCALNDNKKLDLQAAFKALSPYCASINFINITKPQISLGLLKALFTGLPLQCGYFYNAKAKRCIERLIDKHKPDAVYCQLVRTAEYVRHCNIPKAIDYQDVLSMGMKRRADKASPIIRPVFEMEYERLKRYESAVFDDFDVKTIICRPDRDLINHEQRNSITIVPNGVDHDYFAPQNVDKKYDVVFTGNMGYAPNIDAVEYLAHEIMPIVWHTLPNTQLYIAGAQPDAKVKNAASQKVTISGWLDDMRNAYSQSRVFIAPMRIGTGLQNKLLEAMSMKLPCITTPLANDSLGAKPDKEVLVGSNADELAKHIVTLLTDNNKADTIAQSGFNFVHQVYDWDKATQILENEINKNMTIAK